MVPARSSLSLPLSFILVVVVVVVTTVDSKTPKLSEVNTLDSAYNTTHDKYHGVKQS